MKASSVAAPDIGIAAPSTSGEALQWGLLAASLLGLALLLTWSVRHPEDEPDRVDAVVVDGADALPDSSAQASIGTAAAVSDDAPANPPHGTSDEPMEASPKASVPSTSPDASSGTVGSTGSVAASRVAGDVEAPPAVIVTGDGDGIATVGVAPERTDPVVLGAASDDASPSASGRSAPTSPSVPDTGVESGVEIGTDEIGTDVIGPVESDPVESDPVESGAVESDADDVAVAAIDPAVGDPVRADVVGIDPVGTRAGAGAGVTGVSGPDADVSGIGAPASGAPSTAPAVVSEADIRTARRDEELAVLAGLSARLRYAPGEAFPGATGADALARMAEPLSRYPDLDVVVSVYGRELDGPDRDASLARERAGRVIDRLVELGLYRGRFLLRLNPEEPGPVPGQHVRVTARTDGT